MAISKITNFNWQKVLDGAGNGEAYKALLQLRGKAYEVTSNYTKFSSAAPAPDFQGYKKKLKFVGSSVDSLEKMYKTRKLPVYTATLPDFQSKKRAQMIAAAKEVSEAAQNDLADIYKQLEEFDKRRFHQESTWGDAAARFPQVAAVIDKDINDMNMSLKSNAGN